MSACHACGNCVRACPQWVVEDAQRREREREQEEAELLAQRSQQPAPPPAAPAPLPAAKAAAVQAPAAAAAVQGLAAAAAVPPDGAAAAATASGRADAAMPAAAAPTAAADALPVPRPLPALQGDASSTPQLQARERSQSSVGATLVRPLPPLPPLPQPRPQPPLPPLPPPPPAVHPAAGASQPVSAAAPATAARGTPPALPPKRTRDANASEQLTHGAPLPRSHLHAHSLIRTCIHARTHACTRMHTWAFAQAVLR